MHEKRNEVEGQSMKIGDLVMKIAGRDAGLRGVIVKNLDHNKVLVDGEVRRREVNLAHLEPLNKHLEVKEDASHEDVVNLFKIELGVELKASKPKKASEKPKKSHKVKEKKVKVAKKPESKTAPKAEPKTEEKKEAPKSQ
jgi:ribosomal protein L14E/L6E/L27E